MSILLEIKNVHTSIDGTKILLGVDLVIQSGEIHALMGPNGSGKSTLAAILMGHPSYVASEGDVLLNGYTMKTMDPDERARQGLFLAFQYPTAVPGVPVLSFMRAAYNQHNRQEKLTIAKFRNLLNLEAEKLHIDPGLLDRPLNEGFSGGEKKKLEILQMRILKPTMIILDETDSGLDIDALQVVAEAVNEYKKENPEIGILIITHYKRILHYIKPDHVHVMKEGRIVESGDKKLVERLEREGYERISN